MQDTNSLQIDAAAEETPQFLSSRQRKQAARQILARICLSLLILATSVFCLVVLFFGPVRAFGKELSAITAVNFILAILQIQKGIIYETLVKLFLGLMYFAALPSLPNLLCWNRNSRSTRSAASITAVRLRSTNLSACSSFLTCFAAKHCCPSAG